MHFCSICFNLTDKDPCAICQNDQRADVTICVVETPGDQMALEESDDDEAKTELKLLKERASAQQRKLAQLTCADGPASSAAASSSSAIGWVGVVGVG